MRAGETKHGGGVARATPGLSRASFFEWGGGGGGGGAGAGGGAPTAHPRSPHFRETAARPRALRSPPINPGMPPPSRRRRLSTLAALAPWLAVAAAARPPVPPASAWPTAADACPPVTAGATLGTGPAGTAGSLPRPGCAAHFVFDPVDCLKEGKR